MRKILTVIGLVLCTSVFAASHSVQSFLPGDVQWLKVGAGPTSENSGVYTNLLSPACQYWTLKTNAYGIEYTNFSGVRYVVTNAPYSGMFTNGSGTTATAYDTRWGTNLVFVWNDRKLLLKDVNLWNNGQPQQAPGAAGATNVLGVINIQVVPSSNCEATNNSYATLHVSRVVDGGLKEDTTEAVMFRFQLNYTNLVVASFPLLERDFLGAAAARITAFSTTNGPVWIKSLTYNDFRN